MAQQLSKKDRRRLKFLVLTVTAAADEMKRAGKVIADSMPEINRFLKKMNGN